MIASSTIAEVIADHRQTLIGLSHEIAAHPELAFEERYAAQAVATTLRAAGFHVETGIAGLDTAVRARLGNGPLTIAFIAEYDALPGLGHACGHNVIAAAAVGAALGLAAVAEELGVRVVVLGTPAEERGGGKVLLLERGAFDGIHAALMVHPGPKDLLEMPTLATTELTTTYTGRASHASAFPERGVNAEDAATVAQVAIGLLRQHMRSTDRVHGIVVESGIAPNVVPALARMRHLVRSASIDDLTELEVRVENCLTSGALATGCEVIVERTMPVYAQLRSDPELAERYRIRARERGRSVRDLSERARRAAGSTDMGNVSQRIAVIHPMIGVDSLPEVPHQAGFAAICVGPGGDGAVMDGATALALTAADAAAIEPLRHRLLADVA